MNPKGFDQHVTSGQPRPNGSWTTIIVVQEQLIWVARHVKQRHIVRAHIRQLLRIIIMLNTLGGAIRELSRNDGVCKRRALLSLLYVA